MSKPTTTTQGMELADLRRQLADEREKVRRLRVLGSMGFLPPEVRVNLLDTDELVEWYGDGLDPGTLAALTERPDA